MVSREILIYWITLLNYLKLNKSPYLVRHAAYRPEVNHTTYMDYNAPVNSYNVTAPKLFFMTPVHLVGNIISIYRNGSRAIHFVTNFT